MSLGRTAKMEHTFHKNATGAVRRVKGNTEKGNKEERN
jgi:hypothetical protein